VIAFRIDVPLKPWTTNAERKQGHWATRAKRTKEFREAFHRAALSHPPLKWCTITAEPYQKGGILADTAAHNPAVKAAIDGLVDAKIVENDTAEFVRSITFLPVRKGRDGLVLTIEGEEL
jgi:hypothetical protein